MYNKVYCMSNSIFGRFKKNNNNQVIEEAPSVWEDRVFWVSTLEKIAYPVLSNLKKGTLKKNMPIEALSADRQKFTHLAAFGRLFSGIAPWLELGLDGTEEGRIREKYLGLTLRAIENVVSPNSEDYMSFTEPKDSLVNAAFLAQGLLRSQRQVWLNLPIDVQARIIEELKKTRIIAPFENHSLLYTSIIEAALLEFTGECDMERLRYGVFKFWDDWYLGDAIYGDGPEFKDSYINSMLIHPLMNDILIVMRKYNIEGNDFLNKQLMRSSRLSAKLERFISPEGTYPLIGDALTARTGVFHTLSQASLLKILPKNINPAQIRCALTKVLKTQFEGPQNFSNDGWLTIGLNGHQIELAEKNTDTGSLYICSEIFLPLGLPYNDSFWANPFEEWTSLSAWSGHPVERDQSIDF